MRAVQRDARTLEEGQSQREGFPQLRYNDSYGSDVDTEATALCMYIYRISSRNPNRGMLVATKLPGTGGTMRTHRKGTNAPVSPST